MTNYAVLCCLVVAVALLRHASALLWGALFGVAAYALKAAAAADLQLPVVAGRQLEWRHFQFVLYTSWLCVFVWIFGVWPYFEVVGCGATIVIGHALFRTVRHARAPSPAALAPPHARRCRVCAAHHPSSHGTTRRGSTTRRRWRRRCPRRASRACRRRRPPPPSPRARPPRATPCEPRRLDEEVVAAESCRNAQLMCINQSWWSSWRRSACASWPA